MRWWIPVGRSVGRSLQSSRRGVLIFIYLEPCEIEIRLRSLMHRYIAGVYLCVVHIVTTASIVANHDIF